MAVFFRRLGRTRREKPASGRSPALDMETKLFQRAEAASGDKRPDPPRAIEMPDMEMAGVPAVYAVLLKAMAKGADRRAVLGAINSDQGLGLEVEALLLSGAVPFKRPVRGLAEAASVLEPARLCQLACLACLLRSWPGGGPGLDKDLFWDHSLAVGALSGLLATEAGLGRAEDFFLAGLAHDLGRVVQARNRPRSMASVVEHSLAAGSTLVEAEFSRLGHSHATQGSVILRLWPAPLAKLHAVLYHHIPDLAPETAECGVVHLADALAHALCLGFSGERFVPRACPAAIQALGLDVDALSRASDQAVRVMADLESGRGGRTPACDPNQGPFEFF